MDMDYGSCCSSIKNAGSRMLNLKNSFKGQFKGDVSCPRCDLGIDDEITYLQAVGN